MTIGPSPVTLAVSSWSLHRTLGRTWWDSPAMPAVAKPAYGPGRLEVLDLPAAVARHGLDRLQLCHFHVVHRERSWLEEFSAAMKDAGVLFQTLLIDDGDISDVLNHKRDVRWIGGWIDVAAELGARAARVIGGKQKPSPETLALAVAGLTELAGRGSSQGVRVLTENWHDLLPGAREVNHVLDAVGDDLGLLADFGNWKGEEKYDQLAEILPRAEDTHAKCTFNAALSEPDAMDETDFGRCLDIAAAAGYAGPYTLIYDGPDEDEWAGIAAEAGFVRARLAPARRLTA